MAKPKLAEIWEIRRRPTPSKLAVMGTERKDPLPKSRAGAEANGSADGATGLERRVIAFAFRHLDRLTSLEPKVLRGDDADAIHDIRVATRRLQTAMDLLFPKPRSAEVVKLRRRLKRCRRVLSSVRNYDVLMTKAESALSRKRTARREAWEVLREFLEERRSKSFSRSARKLSKANLSTLYLQLRRHLAAASAEAQIQAPDVKSFQVGGFGGHPLRVRLIASVQEAQEGFERRLQACVDKSGAQANHKLRIAAKQMRYLVELLRDSGVHGSHDALIWLRKVQRQLGDLHDTDVLEQAIIEMIARPEFLRDHLELSFEAARLVKQIRHRKRARAEKFIGAVAYSPEHRRIQDLIEGLPESLSAEADIA